MILFCNFILQSTLNIFMITSFQAVRGTKRAMKLLQRFENLRLPDLPIQQRYQHVLKLYNRDIDLVAKMYKTFRLDPYIAYDQPPMAGRIAWARQLYHRITYPIEFLQANSKVMLSREGRMTAKNYNRLSRTLIEYEIVYHNAWLRQVVFVCFQMFCAQHLDDASWFCHHYTWNNPFLMGLTYPWKYCFLNHNTIRSVHYLQLSIDSII